MYPELLRVQESEPSHTAGGNVKWCRAALENNLTIPQKFKHSITCDDHSSPHVSFNSGFLGVYAQQWDGW